MTEEEIFEEIRITKRMLKKLETWKFADDRRVIKWDVLGHHYEIDQQTDGRFAGEGEGIVAQTTFWRDDQLHNLNGPALDYNLGDVSKQLYVVKGKAFEYDEYNFFITAMIP